VNVRTIPQAIEDPQDNPEVTFQNRQKAEILLNCLTKLSPAHREIIDLVYYHEKPIDEVAEIVGIPPNTVKTRMFYARKQIRCGSARFATLSHALPCRAMPRHITLSPQIVERCGHRPGLARAGPGVPEGQSRQSRRSDGGPSDCP
jgi:Sigma-70, region 4